MNHACILHFPITKLGKLNSLTGRSYFKTLVYILSQLKRNHITFGITYYSDPRISLFKKLFKWKTGSCTNESLALFSDFSWQNFSSTGRITENYNFKQLNHPLVKPLSENWQWHFYQRYSFSNYHFSQYHKDLNSHPCYQTCKASFHEDICAITSFKKLNSTKSSWYQGSHQKQSIR